MSLLELHGKISRKRRKLLGRGNATGHGTYSGRGGKGQTARSGGRRRPGFEGGQTPFSRKMPKLKGFKNPNKINYQIVNLGKLNIFENNDTVDQKLLYQKKLISKKNKPVKLLASKKDSATVLSGTGASKFSDNEVDGTFAESSKGSLEKSLKIIVNKASKKAIAEVQAKKGEVKFLTKENA